MFEENIFGLVPKKDLLDIGYDVTRQNEPADRLFGDVKTDNLLAYWETMSSEYNLPVMAQYHAFDTVTRKTIRRPIDTKNIEKGLTKGKTPQLQGRSSCWIAALWPRPRWKSGCWMTASPFPRKSLPGPR